MLVINLYISRFFVTLQPFTLRILYTHAQQVYEKDISKKSK